MMSTPSPFVDYNGGFAAGENLLRLHLNESPYGPPPGITALLRQELDAHAGRYPESSCEPLRAQLADALGIAPAMVAIGNGADELVLLATLGMAGAGQAVAITEGTFPGYLSAARVVGAQPRAVPMREHGIDADAVIEAIGDGAKLIFVCNPHNPTGSLLSMASIERILDQSERHGATLIVDEAYMDYVEEPAASALALVRGGRRLVVLRTFSKAWGMAALRVGYAAGHPQLIARMWAMRQALPFNVNRCAQRAVPHALQAQAHLHRVRRDNCTVRDTFCRQLYAAGIRFLPSATNFVMLLAIGDSAAVAGRLVREHGILVRDLGLFGWSGCLRVSMATAADMQRCVAALCACLAAT
ncbi:histidinol-phosphate aminotransferase [Xanthomonas sacchari]|uniref:pyridoxal phosphate-dependent aminotransferase n=1 Tax=Xanthomonas sacchari TaxID=56458 RepID=UPI00277F18C5|nr:histidinol-phosphate transaminase [Xanthomonas sacchari]MDQ1091019.1 histidinol-phosphate aminotransferase [Xanthomonas sacchari]